MIIIVDYGMGNLGSVFNMFKKVGAQSKISGDLEEISRAEKLLLPGVGAFDAAMSKINEKGLLPILNQKALTEKIPVLGICLGMQLLTNSSEEGNLKGLGWIKASAKKIQSPANEKIRVPHMGWNVATVSNPSPITKDLPAPSKFYFVHSFSVHVENQSNSMLKTNYGGEFDSGIQNDNIFGVQFHPEKSHKYGMKIFENFWKL